MPWHSKCCFWDVNNIIVPHIEAENSLDTSFHSRFDCIRLKYRDRCACLTSWLISLTKAREMYGLDWRCRSLMPSMVMNWVIRLWIGGRSSSFLMTRTEKSTMEEGLSLNTNWWYQRIYSTFGELLVCKDTGVCITNDLSWGEQPS